MKEAIIYLLAITVADVVTVIVQPVWGIGCHILVLVAVLLHSALGLADRHRLQQLVLSLALVPLIRIISLSMPLTDIPQIWWYPIVYAPLLAAAVIVVRITGLRRGDIGLVVFRLFPVQLGVALTGLLFGVAEYFILHPEPMISEFTWQEAWLLALIFVACTGFVEELIFRGVLQRTAVETFGWRGIIYISLIFAVVHIIHYSAIGLRAVLIDIAFVFVIALFFGWVVKKTGSLVGVTLSHGITNTVLYLVAPFFF